MRSRVFPLLVALASVWPMAAAGLTPLLVKDIKQIPQPADSSPSSFVTVGGVSFFTASDNDTDQGFSDTGRQLWRTDGTPAGTYRLVDVCTQACSPGQQVIVAVTDRSVFFLAFGKGGRDLWVSGGTPATTFRLTATPLNFEFPLPRRLWIAGQGLLYFAADDGIHGTELWRSDGTAAGTYLIADLWPGSQGSRPAEMAELKGRLYFSANDAQRGPVLWKSDGTPQGTQIVRDPIPSSASHTGPVYLRTFGGALFFVAPAPGLGTELWKSDGTTRGTAPFIELVRGAGSPQFYDFSVIGGRLYFVAEAGSQGRELWTTDGTSRGTKVLTNFPKAEAFGSLPRIPLGTKIVFAADDGPHGTELWVSDGTSKGTRLLRDICPGTCSGGSSGTVSGNRVFFSGYNPVRGIEPWITDGTPEGTRIIRDICRGTCNSGPYGIVDVGGKVLFGARDVPNGVSNLWRTDGTASGTIRLTDFDKSEGLAALDTTILDGILLFPARDEHGLELWRSDGTPAGTQLLADINTRDLGGSFPSNLKAVGNTLFFFADDGTRHGLFESDGTEAGTAFVYDFSIGIPYPDPPPSVYDSGAAAGKLFLTLSFTNELRSLWRTDGTETGTLRLTPQEVGASRLYALGETVFFVGNDGDHGAELWKTDGTVAGTVRVKDVNLGLGSNPALFTAFQDRLYFTADALSGRELWVSDGTEAGTVLLKDIDPQLASSPELLTVHAGRLWFFAFDSEHGRELWSTNGTEAGTVLFTELAPGSDYFVPSGMVAAGPSLFFSGEGGSSGNGHLWVTDGTAAGLRRIGPVQFRRDPFGESRPVSFGGELFFAGSESGYDDVLWKSDGTEAGTLPLLDWEGQLVPSPRAFQIFGGRVVFTTLDGGLWQTDGTTVGTFEIRNVAGPGESGFRELVPVGARLFFRGYDRDHGTELWALEP